MPLNVVLEKLVASPDSRGIIRLHTALKTLSGLASPGEIEVLRSGKEPAHEHCRATSAAKTCSS